VSQKAGRLYAFDTHDGHRLQSVATGPAPFGLAGTPDGQELWVTTLRGEVRRFRLVDLAPLATLTPGGRLRRLAFDPEGRGVVIADENGRIVVFR
jgi:sugar lactone lactonase YvrE